MGDTYGDNPVHPIIESPSQYDLVRFDIYCDPEKPRAAYLDLWLRRGTELRRLRFTQPSSINIKDGFQQRCSGMVILDVRHWGWEDVGVAVRDFENSDGGVSFNAKDVQELMGGAAECG